MIKYNNDILDSVIKKIDYEINLDNYQLANNHLNKSFNSIINNENILQEDKNNFIKGKSNVFMIKFQILKDYYDKINLELFELLGILQLKFNELRENVKKKRIKLLELSKIIILKSKKLFNDCIQKISVLDDEFEEYTKKLSNIYKSQDKNIEKFKN
jgi:hypothetical protein